MPENHSYNAAVIGSGPNGLAAAITLAQAGLKVIIYEAKSSIGGGMRSAELTLPGFIHDICSAIHPLGIASPFFCNLPLDKFGLEWIYPKYSLAHPLDDGTAAILDPSIDVTGETLGIDCFEYKKIMSPLVSEWDKLATDILGPLHIPNHPFVLARFGILGIQSAHHFAKRFKDKKAKGFFAGLAAHSMMPLDWSLTAAFGLVLAILGHAKGWPFPRGGSQKIANALESIFISLGGKIITNKNIQSLEQLSNIPIVLFDNTPRQILEIVGDRFSTNYRRKLERYRYGPGVFKMDWALNHPIPWKAKECRSAGTIHIGGTQEEIELSEREVWEGRHPQYPFLIIAQQSLFDSSRAPNGKHTAWGYCHVPNGSTFDMSERIESQIERFAPGFRDCIMARSAKTAMNLQEYNPNYIGGDINGGVQDIFQFFTRPVARWVPYSTPIDGLYICSSSTPPGGGVHGMCGYHSACAALHKFK